MEAEFWQRRWHDNQIGFHQARVSPLLERHWDALSPPAGGRVFVPLCGKSLDMAWLAARGHRILGVELSELAVRQFFDEQGLAPDVRDSRYGTHYSAGPYELICGDAFALDAQALADCGAVHDRAALIALPAELRRRYLATAYAALPPGCRGLLITLEYPQAEMDGPPFSVGEAEVRTLFAGWSATLAERRDILAQEPRFAADGVSALHTAAYFLQNG
ncbi:thiopurine S-methyltransferase [Luteimonas aquatica]|uniref:thiopurine S-methyltransferase n=1 Tax=Luteimonas aquatica TaxID=450364 RepID=UPI001F5A9A00|nr:thiopurine S-methyltransferase [Luteimonas aquatica]